MYITPLPETDKIFFISKFYRIRNLTYLVLRDIISYILIYFSRIRLVGFIEILYPIRSYYERILPFYVAQFDYQNKLYQIKTLKILSRNITSRAYIKIYLVQSFDMFSIHSCCCDCIICIGAEIPKFT